MKRESLILLVLLLVAVTPLYAQEARNGTNAAAQLMVPVDARYLGGAGAAAMASGIEGVLWNPAGVDRASGDIMLMASHRSYIADIGVNFAGIGFQFGDLGAIAVHLRSFDIGEIEETDEFNMDGTGESFSPTFFTLGATFSRQMTDRISIGVTSNLVYENFANVGTSGVVFDAGVQYQDFLGFSGLALGVAIRNIGTSMTYDGSALFRDARAIDGQRPNTKYKVATADADVPTVVDLGVGYQLYRGLNVSVTYHENTYGPSELRGLASYDFMGYLTVRGGYTATVVDQGELESIFDGVAFGGTLNLQPVIGMDVAVDYGYMPVKYFDANHIFSLRGNF